MTKIFDIIANSDRRARTRALLLNTFALALTVLVFFLIDSEFAPGFAPEFHVSAFWFTAAILSIYLCAAALLIVVYRIFRDVFFAVLTWYFVRKERRTQNV